MYNAGSDILNAYMQGVQFKKALEDRDWNKQMEKAKFQEQSQQFQQQLAWQKEHGRAQLALSKAIQDLQHINMKADLEEKMGKGLLPATGTEYRGQAPDFSSISEGLQSKQAPTGTFQAVNDQLMPGEVLRSVTPEDLGAATAAMQRPTLEMKSALEAKSEAAKLIQKFLLDTQLEGTKTEGRKAVAKQQSDARMEIEQYRQGQENYRASLKEKSDKQTTVKNNQILRILNAHDQNPVTKRAIVADESIRWLNDTIPADGKIDASLGQSLIYQFAKISDPSSTVRPSEYAEVMKWAQPILTSLGLNFDRIYKYGEILTPKAVKQIERAIRAKASSIHKSYASYRDTDVTNRLEQIGGPGTAKQWLPQFMALDSESGKPFKVGGTYNGQKITAVEEVK